MAGGETGRRANRAGFDLLRTRISDGIYSGRASARKVTASSADSMRLHLYHPRWSCWKMSWSCYWTSYCLMSYCCWKSCLMNCCSTMSCCWMSYCCSTSCCCWKNCYCLMSLHYQPEDFRCSPLVLPESWQAPDNHCELQRCSQRSLRDFPQMSNRPVPSDLNRNC